MNTTTTSPNLTRVRAGVRAVLALGVAASIAANILHAEPNAVGRAIAAWSPLALLLTVELISRVPVTGRGLSGLRMTATATIAGIAAWVSYWHMVSVAERYGEQTTSAHLLPLSVDGLVVVASISLVEIAGQLRRTALPELAELTELGADAAGAAVEGQSPQAPGPAPAEPATDPATAPQTARKPRAGHPPVKASAAVTVARLRAKHPAWTVGQIAGRAGVSERTARRHLNASSPASTQLAAPSDLPPAPAAADLAA